MPNILKIIFCLFFIFSCESQDGQGGGGITNPSEPNYDYSMMLRVDTLAIRSKHYVDVIWNMHPISDEVFTDENNNAIWDDEEPFIDADGDGFWDPADDFIDCNDAQTICDGDDDWDPTMGNGIWDDEESLTTDNYGNGIWDNEESYMDTNANGVWDDAEPLIDTNNNNAWDITLYTLLEIREDNSDKTIEDDIAIEDTSFNMNFFPGMFQETCLIAISSTSNETTSSDTVQFFTMPLEPPKNLTISSETGQNTMSWTPSSDNISEIIIYRYRTESTTPPVPIINVDSTEPDIMWENIFSGTNDNISFADEDVYPEYHHFYTIKARIQDITENLDGFIYSYIVPDVSDLLKEVEEHDLSVVVSDSYKSMIKIEWFSYEFDDFYKYQIWRSDTPDELDTLEDDELLVEIVDKDINYFEDRNNIGTGKTWYYKIRVYNMYENYLESSGAVAGYTIL